jgi:methionyl aminopeptidase
VRKREKIYKKCHLGAEAASSPARLKPRFLKTPGEIEGMRRAGAFNGELMDYIRPFVKAGISTLEINTLVHDYTVRHGHVPACLGYRGFPKSLCTSINNVVCHGIPSSERCCTTAISSIST